MSANPRRSGTAIPTLDAPGPVVEASHQLRAYAAERRALGEQPERPGNDRRSAALGLLVDDARHALLAAVDEHGPQWSDALTDRVTATTETYRAALGDLNDARRDTTVAASVLAWLDSSELTPYREHSQPRLAGERPWTSVLAALHTDADPDAPAPEVSDLPAPRQPTPRSLAHISAVLPTLDMPDPLAEPYAEHRALVEQHIQLGQQRRNVEAGRREAQTRDQRELADAIRDGQPDPGDRHVTALDTEVDDIDRTRAGISVDVQDSYRNLARLVHEHRDGWRAAVAQRHSDAAQRYTEAVATLTEARKAAHAARDTAEWLAASTPTELARWTPRDQPMIAGEPWDTLHALLRQDLAQHTTTTAEHRAA